MPAITKIQHNGEVRSLTEWSKDSMVSPQTLGSRLRNGMAMEEAMTTPSQSVFTPTRTLKSREDVQWELDDMQPGEYHRLPVWIAPMMLTLQAKKKGQYIRRHHPDMFKRYYDYSSKEPRRVD